MKKKFKIKTKVLIFILPFLVFTNLCSSKEKENNPPNIIIFLVDDMGLMDSSVPFLTDSNGKPVKYPLNDFYNTPNMVKLADQGISFSNFYAHSVCSPSRISILTGQNSARHRATNWIYPQSNNKTTFGPTNWNWKGLTKESVTLPRVLQKAGYKTIHVGKAHFGPTDSEGEDPLNIGFDVNIGGCAIGRPGSYLGSEGYGHIAGDKRKAVPGLEKYHGTDVFLTEALTLEANLAITKAKEEGKPFFLNMSHYAVHAPFYSDPRFADNYKNSNKSKHAKAYATLIEGMDKSLGDIIFHVKELGLGENTLLLFLGDNGSDAPLPIKNGYSSSSPIRGKKGNHWEGGMRVPFIASWVSPNEKIACQKKTPISSNTIQTQQGTIMDIFTTLCKVANVKHPKDHVIDGFELQTQFKNKQNKRRDEIFLNHFPHGKHRSTYYTSLVKSDWKIIYHYPTKEKVRYELFDLKNDPFEKDNLMDKNPKQLKKMMKVLSTELEKTNALYPEKESQSLELIMP
jgi:arylsulfatase A-like enzyme